MRSRNADLDRLDLTPAAGALHVRAAAQDADGSTDFSFDVVPILTTDRDERNERVTFETRNRLPVALDCTVTRALVGPPCTDAPRPTAPTCRAVACS